MPKPPTLSSLRPAKRTVYRGSTKKLPPVKPLPPLVKVKGVTERRDRLTHIEHIEDRFIKGGNIDLSYTLRTMTEVHNMLVASMEDRHYKSSAIITEKFDGSPSIVFGHDKETGRFFVATKSFFSKSPKLNFSEEDIRLNHGYSSNLLDKLTAALKYLPKITPETGIFQGDLMYVQGMNVETAADKIYFTANTVNYSCYSDTFMGKRIYDSRIGIAIHTQHITDRHIPADLTLFNKDEDVVVIDPRININRAYYPAEHQKEFLTLLQEINNTPLTQSEVNEVMRHSVKLMQYINKIVKGTAVPREESEFASPIFDAFFFVHSHLQAAKKLLNDALSNTRQFYTEINGQETKGEGFVVIYEQRMNKIVDREEFSRQNFMRQTELKEGAKTTVFAFARMNPPTRGHEHLIQQVKRLAKEHKAGHTIALSPSHGIDNPLSASLKFEYLKELFPGTDFYMRKSSAGFIRSLCDIYEEGTEHLILVSGDDRMESYQSYLELNGKDNFFHFKKISFVSAGARNPEGEGIEAVSGTRVRQYADDNQFDKFFKDLPSTATEELAKRLFEDVRKGLIKYD
jgi:hypothetical protein